MTNFKNKIINCVAINVFLLFVSQFYENFVCFLKGEKYSVNVFTDFLNKNQRKGKIIFPYLIILKKMMAFFIFSHK